MVGRRNDEIRVREPIPCRWCEVRPSPIDVTHGPLKCPPLDDDVRSSQKSIEIKSYQAVHTENESWPKKRLRTSMSKARRC